jgi:hypothetical protein
MSHCCLRPNANFEFLDLLHAQAPIENNLKKLLPERIHFSYTLGFNGYRSFAKNVKEYLTNKNLQQTYQSYADSLEVKINMPFVRRLGDNIGNHASLFVLDEPGISKDSNYVVAIESVDEANFAALMQQIHTRWEFVDSLNDEKDTLDNAFIKLPFANLFKYYFTDLLSPFPVNYCVQKGKYFFFTNITW